MATISDNNPWEKNIPQQISSAAPVGTNSQQSAGSGFNLRKVLRVWPIAVFTAALGVFGAWLFLRYAIPVYQASMQVSLKDDLSATAVMPSGTFNMRDPFNDKVDMLKSPTVAWRIVDKLHLCYGAVSKGQLKNKDLYGSLSWTVLNENPNVKPFSFILKPLQNNSFNWQSGNKQGRAIFNLPFEIGQDTVVVYTQSRFSPEAEIYCTKYDQWTLARSTASRLIITPQTKSSTVIVTYSDVVPQRALDILGSLAEAYDINVIESKNKSLQQSIRFIQERLNPLSYELDSIESSIVRFKSVNKIMGGSEVVSSFLANSSAIDAGLAQIELQFELLKMVQQYVNDPNTKDENLSLVGLESGDLQGFVSSFQQLRRERDQIFLSTEANHPNRVAIDEEVRKAKDNINVQIENYRRALVLKQKNLAGRLGDINAKLSSAPIEERELLAMQRQQKIKQELYVLLLQRKEEAAITLASTTSETSVLSPPETGGPVSPKRAQFYAIGLGLGLLLPFAFAFAKELLDHSITSKKQIQAATGAPVLGVVDLANLGANETMIIDQGDRRPVAEQIRSIRANLSFYAEEGKTQYIMISSSFSGEGKTFISANLAKTFAMQGLRVALMEFDMRKPRLASNFGMKPTKGLSGALLGQHSFEEIILKDSDAPNLHLYPTGAVPPNPSELMANARMKVLKSYIDQNYDVVVMDTPPMGLVSDAQLLANWSDVTLLVVRYGFTPKEQLQEINEWYRKGVLGKMAIVFNGVKRDGYYGYSSSYYGRYGYHNYYTENGRDSKGQKNFLGRLFSKK